MNEEQKIELKIVNYEFSSSIDVSENPEKLQTHLEQMVQNPFSLGYVSIEGRSQISKMTGYMSKSEYVYVDNLVVLHLKKSEDRIECATNSSLTGTLSFSDISIIIDHQLEDFYGKIGLIVSVVGNYDDGYIIDVSAPSQVICNHLYVGRAFKIYTPPMPKIFAAILKKKFDAELEY